MEAHSPALPTHGRIAGVRDEGLARLVGNGSERAFTALYQRYHQQLYRYCRSMLRDDADAQDALQSTFTAAFAALRERRRDAPLRPWLFRIAHNEAINIMRRRRPEAELPHELAANLADTEQAAERHERLQRLVSDLRELPERQRAALLMRELSGLSHEEIALALQSTAGAAKQTIFEARRALAELEEGRMTPCDEICRRISDGDGRALRARKVAAHLRDCASCAAFAAAIPGRSSDLRALAPALPPAATALLLSRTLGAAASGSGGSAGGGALGAGAAGKTTLALSGAKVATTVALAATATLGVGVALKPATHRTPPVRARPAAVAAPGLAAPKAHTTHARVSTSTRTTALAHTAAAHSSAPRRTETAVRHHVVRAATVTRHQRSHHTATTSVGGAPRLAAAPTTRSHGNSQNAPGHNKSAALGNSHSTERGNAGAPPGQTVSANAPGHVKAPRSPGAGVGSHASANGLAHSNRNSS
jgi:RNA polymerase sigma factor (sigma-70 family)